MARMKTALYAALAALAAAYVAIWIAHARRARGADGVGPDRARPSPLQLAIGFVTNFFDTLGIGSFAPTTSLFRLLRAVPDELIPGTLLVGHAVPLVAQAFVYITIIQVDVTSLSLLIAAACAGAWLGAGVVARWPRRKVQTGMGGALLIAAGVMLGGLLNLVPAGGDALGLSGARLAVGLGGNFVLGALMTIGIGAYAPSLILFGLLGMNLRAVFPVMMGSCAFLTPLGAMRFLRAGRFSPRAALGLALGGLPGVFLAAFIVKELPLDALRWFVLAVVIYTAVTMLRSARRETSGGQP